MIFDYFDNKLRHFLFTGCSFQQAAQPSGEIIMNLDQVCPSGQRMKFSVPGVSQAVTLNFSAEALQEMKNAALRTTRATLQPEQGTYHP